MNSLLTGECPKRVFSAAYMLKDVKYALGLAEEKGLRLPAANLTKVLLQQAVQVRYADDYFPALIKLISSD